MGASLEKTKLKLIDPTSDIPRYLVISNDKWEIQDNTGATILVIESHASRHSNGGADAIPAEGLIFGQLDKSFGTESTVSVGAGATSTIAKGIYYVCCGANTTVEYSPDGGTTWRTAINAGGT